MTSSRRNTSRTEVPMIAEKTTKNANFIRILTILRNLRDGGSITDQEYIRAKKYYQKLTGADIVLAG